MRQPVLQLLLLCTALTACAAETVTVPGNSCVVPKYMITNTPTTYALNLSSLAGSPSGICSAESLLVSQDLLTTDECQMDTSGGSEFQIGASTDSSICASGYNSTEASCIQDFNYFQGTGSGSLARLTGETGPWFNSTACSNYDTFFFIYNSCNESVSLTYEVLEAKETAITDTFCSYIGADEGAHTAAIAIGSIAAAIAVFFIIAICCGAFVPCCAGCAGLALLRANRRANANMAPGPMPPAQFQPGYGMGAPMGAPPPGSYQPFDVYQQQHPQPYPTSGPAPGPATGTPAYGGQYDAGAAPIYGGGYPQNAAPVDFSKPTYGPPGGAPRY